MLHYAFETSVGSFLSLNGIEQCVRQGPQSTSSTVINLKTAFCAGGKKNKKHMTLKTSIRTASTDGC